MDLAEKIKIYRKRKNLTQQELADTVGVSIMTMRRWEWNERIPRADEMSKLAAALGTTVGALMGESEPEPQKNLPIDNSGIENKIPNETPEYLDLGYWGNVAENAKRAAKSEDYRKPLVAALLNTAVNEFSECDIEPIIPKNSVIGVQGNISDGKNNVNVGTS